MYILLANKTILYVDVIVVCIYGFTYENLNIFDRSFHYLQKNQNKMECLCDAVLQLRWMFTPLNWGLTVVWIGILFILTVCLFINKRTISNQKGIYSKKIFFTCSCALSSECREMNIHMFLHIQNINNTGLQQKLLFICYKCVIKTH